MSKNPLYANEIATAHQFILKHNTDAKLQSFLHDIRFRKDLMHSDRWSLCYDFLNENYPEASGTVVTGLAYWLEDQEVRVPCSKNPRQLMLFNDYVVELQDVMTNKNLVNRL